jgi:cytochrome c-type biogenesis protein CcmH/NrfF
MKPGVLLGILLLAGIFAFQVRTTLRVWRSRVFDKPQKVAQSRLIWLLPVIGAAIVGSVLEDEERRDRGEPPRLGS